MKSVKLTLIFVLVLICCFSHSQILEMKCYNDSVITVNKDELFELKFSACHDCGSRWFLEYIDTTGVKLIDQTNHAYSKDLQFTGKTRAGGYAFEIWTFTGLKSGDFRLLFYYKRFGRDIQKIEQRRIIIK